MINITYIKHQVLKFPHTTCNIMFFNIKTKNIMFTNKIRIQITKDWSTEAIRTKLPVVKLVFHGIVVIIECFQNRP